LIKSRFPYRQGGEVEEENTDNISIQTARQVLLAAQGLDRLPDRPARKDDVLSAVRRMGVLQIDTIHIVARSPYLVLWTRLGSYQPNWLDELLAEHALFEYWSHAMCFVPIEDYPLYRRRMLDNLETERAWIKWGEDRPDVMERVRSRLRENGSVRSVEFETAARRPGGWWNWKDEKTALELLLLTGEVMIARRQNFQRVYTLRQHLLPEWDDANAPSTEEVRRQLTLRAVGALGVASPGWIADYFRLPKKGMLPQLNSLLEAGLIDRVTVEGFAETAYFLPANRHLLEEAAAGILQSTVTTMLSPFDPLVWDRQRARQLFGFDYTIECYTPAAKRIYGYFTLPILHQGRLVGRLDPKAHRAQGIFEVKSIHIEPGVELSTELVSGLAEALNRLAAWHDTPDLRILSSSPPELKTRLEKTL
jgi:uncharacterized protein YcaQ